MSQQTKADKSKVTINSAKHLLVFLTMLLGSVSWEAPPWLRAIVRGVKKLLSYRHSAPRAFWGIGLSALLLLTGSWYGLRWYQNRPKPRLVTMRSSTLHPTRLKKHALPDVLTLYFSESAAPLKRVGKTVSAGISINPPIRGSWYWKSDKELSFTLKAKPLSPENLAHNVDWVPGQEYQVSFDKSFFADHVKLEVYKHSFKSAAFKAWIDQTQFYEDPIQPQIKKVVTTVRFSHSVDKADFEKRISYRLNLRKGKPFDKKHAKPFGFRVFYDPFAGEAYIHSTPISVPKEDREMLFTFVQGARSRFGGNKTVARHKEIVRIPGVYTYLKVAKTYASTVKNENSETERILVLETNIGVRPDELSKQFRIVQLPQNRPAFQGRPAADDYSWYDASQVGPEVLQLAEEVPVQWMPVEQDFSTIHTLRYKAETGRWLYLQVKKGLKSFGGYLLAEEFNTTLRVEPLPQEIEILHDGSILSISGEKKISILTRDVEAVQFEVSRVLPQTVHHLVALTHGNLKNPQFRSYDFTADNLSQRFTEVRTLARLEPGKSQYSVFDFAESLSRHAVASSGIFLLKVQNWDPVRKEVSGVSDKRLFLISDLGVLVKDSRDGTHDVFVQSIRSGLPEEGVEISVLGKNGLPVITRKTDDRGHTRFPDISDFSREKTAVVYVLSKNDDFSFIPFKRQDRRLNLSRFNVGGLRTTSNDREDLDAYLFSDRGIYRPGEELRIGVIVKPRDWRRDISGMPLELTLRNSRGQEIHKRIIRFPADGFAEYRYTTQETSPTGRYQVSLYIVKDGRRENLLGSTALRVEEFQPDRMKIASGFLPESSDAWVSPQGLKAWVALENLYGVPAADRRVSLSFTLTPTFTGFSKYAKYRFHDALKAKHHFNQDLPDQKTDAQGKTQFDLNLKRFKQATYRLSFAVRGYEAGGGRSVSTSSSVLVSPLEYLIGHKTDGGLRYLKKGTERTLDLIAVDRKLSGVEVSDLTSQLIEIRYVSVLKKQANGTFAYQSVKKEIPLTEQQISIPAQGLKYQLPTGQAGDYLLIFRGAKGLERLRLPFSIVGKGNLTRALEKNAELQIVLDKKDYLPGEEIELQIKAPYVGAGLITIERDRVYQFKWFTTATTTAIERIRVPEQLEGNAYINVSFVRNLGSREVFMSPLSYGVKPFTISRQRKTNKLHLDVPERALPGERYTIRYRSEHPGRIVIFAVDEGILQVARYVSPNPLAYFFRKRALEVETSQIVDLILPEFSVLRELSGTGGGEDVDLGRNLNPFKRKHHKAVAYWSGIIDTDGNDRELHYDIPDYFSGTLRVIALSVSTDRLGVREAKSLIRGHFVITPHLSTFLAPQDEAVVSVSVANAVEDSGEESEITVRLSSTEHLEVLDQASRTLKIAEGSEKTLRYWVRAKGVLGGASLTFEVSNGDKSSSYTDYLSVRPANPFITRLTTGYFTTDSEEVAIKRSMYPEFRTTEASASTLPLGLARGLVTYLDRYPYSCTEQLLSQAFPVIALSKRPEFNSVLGVQGEKIDDILNILQARQNAEGAFGYWAANSHGSPFVTVYAAHFLTEAADRGFAVPRSLLQKALDYLKKIAGRKEGITASPRVRAYAIYLLTRNGVITTNYINSLRERLEEDQPKRWKRSLSSLYLAASYQLLKQDKEADNLMDHARLVAQVDTSSYRFYDTLTHNAQYLFILAKHFPERLADLEAEFMLRLVKPITLGEHNTLSSAYAVLAFDTYAAAVGTPERAQLQISELDDKDNEAVLSPSKGLFAAVTYSDRAKKIRFEGDTDLPLFYQITEAGFDRGAAEEEIKDKLEVVREYRNQQGKIVYQAELGERVNVHLRVRAIGGQRYQNIALVDLLPGGLEIDMHEGSSSLRRTKRASRYSWSPDFVDIREDRVLLFGTIDSQAKEYVYQAVAKTRGSFDVPPLFAESMYDRTVQARSLGGTLSIVEAE